MEPARQRAAARLRERVCGGVSDVDHCQLLMERRNSSQIDHCCYAASNSPFNKGVFPGVLPPVIVPQRGGAVFCGCVNHKAAPEARGLYYMPPAQ